jgi:DNA-binding winged helix-turn-helix (wHTH) protein/TolB-like protein
VPLSVSMLFTKGHFYEFGPFRLNPAERLLLRDDIAVSLSPKGFQLLVFLVTNHGRLVTKDQIFEAVWAGSFVEESNLTVNISALRRALGEKESGLQYIETVTKAGYRFTAQVLERADTDHLPKTPYESPASLPEESSAAGVVAQDEIQPLLSSAKNHGMKAVADWAVSVPIRNPSPDETAPGSSWNRAGILLLVIFVPLFALLGYWRVHRTSREAVTRHPRTLAVLPFQNLTHDANSDFLGFSLADAVITKLGYVGALNVRPSSAIEKYRDQTIDIQKVGAELKVDTLLTGNVVREGDDLRITPQLIDVATNRILWKGTIDLKYENLLEAQDNVSREIIKGLALNLTPSQSERLAANAPNNSLAYEYYLRGVDLYARNEFPMAIKMLEKSIELDPNYAPTWAQIGRAYTTQASFRFGGREQYLQAQAAYEKAMALEPAHLETRIYMANLLTDTGRVEQAVPLLRQALKDYPNNAELHWELGYAYRFGGMLRESVEECEHARLIDPGVKLTTSAPNGYLYLGQYDKFLQSLPDINDSAFILFYRGFGEFHKKDTQQAIRDFDRAYELDPSLLQANVGKALSYGLTQQTGRGLEILQAAEKKVGERGVGDPEAIYKLAEAYAALGDKPSALRMLRHSIESGFFPYSYLENDPMLDPLRNETEFAQLMSATGQRQQAFERALF